MRIFACVVVLLVALPAVAAPEGDETARKEESRRLTELGTAAYQNGDHAAALALFEKAERIYPSPNFAYNRGLALAGLGRTVEAVEAFEAFLKDAPDAPAEARAHAQGRIEELGKQLGAVEITVDAPGASATLDGKQAPVGRAVRVRAGPHVIAVTAPGRRPAERDLRIDAGQTERLALALEPAVAAAPPPPSPAPPPVVASRGPRPVRVAAITLLVTALALGGAGAGVYLAPYSEYQSKRDACAGQCAPSELEGLRTRVEVATVAGAVLWGLAGAAAVADIALWAMDARGARAERVRAALRGQVRF